MAKDTYIPRNEVVDMNKEFNKVRREAEEALLGIPGVKAVGVGLKEVKGEAQPELCFKVTVDKKRSASDLRTEDIVPEKFYGFKTDVNEVVLVLPGVNESKYRPMIGGSQIEQSKQPGQGTMGCFAKRNSDNKIVVLSNWHVMVSNPDAVDGERVGQPTHNGCCSCCACNEIGNVTDGRFRTDNMDAAIALLKGQDTDTVPEERYINEIIQIGFVAGSETPVPGETIYKYGRTTGFTKGQIMNDNSLTDTPYEFYEGVVISRASQYEITPLAPYADFFLTGDSGSVSVNEHNQVVLLNYSFDPNTHKTFANNIKTVESVLGISILDSTFHAGIANRQGVPLSSGAFTPAAFGMTQAMEELESELLRFREGRRIMELFRQHRTEALNLVNKNREVMAAWNRYQGPSWLANIARSVHRDNKPVPDHIKGITLQSLLLKMTAVLQRNGSPELAQSVSDNYLQVMKVLAAGQGPEEWKARLAEMDQQMYS